MSETTLEPRTGSGSPVAGLLCGASHNASLQRQSGAEDFLAAVRGERKRCGQPPFYVIRPPEESIAAGRSIDTRGGMLLRKCTKEYKITPIQQKVRHLMKETGAKQVQQFIGISLDEVHRMKHSGVNYIQNVYPLIDMRMSRWDCLRWIEKAGLPQPPKSACWHCP